MSRKELLSLLPKGFEFKTTPWDHQIASLACCLAYDGFLIALDLGTGKTKVAIDHCRYLGKSVKALVVCMNSAVENWEDEVRLHSDLRAVCLRGPTAEKWDKLKGDGIFIINFE